MSERYTTNGASHILKDGERFLMVTCHLTDERAASEVALSIAAALNAQPQPQASAEPVKRWCETCAGTGSVYQEPQAGCHVGGDRPCPDCDADGFVLIARQPQPQPQASAENPVVRHG